MVPHDVRGAAGNRTIYRDNLNVFIAEIAANCPDIRIVHFAMRLRVNNFGDDQGGNEDVQFSGLCLLFNCDDRLPMRWRPFEGMNEYA
jgi:hypothetical protein